MLYRPLKQEIQYLWQFSIRPVKNPMYGINQQEEFSGHLPEGGGEATSPLKNYGKFHFSIKLHDARRSIGYGKPRSEREYPKIPQLVAR